MGKIKHWEATERGALGVDETYLGKLAKQLVDNCLTKEEQELYHKRTAAHRNYDHRRLKNTDS